MGRAKHRKLKKAGTKTLVSLDKKLPSRRPPEHKRFREQLIAKEKKAMAKKKRKAPGSHPPIKSHGDLPAPKQRSPAAEERRAAKQEKKRAKKQAKREAARASPAAIAEALSGRPHAPPAAPTQPNGSAPAQPPATPKPLSNWLGKFLSTPRSTDIIDASGLEDAPMDDTYMRGFADRCRQESKPEAHDSSDDESVHVPPPPPVQETFSVFVANVPFAVTPAQVRAVCAETGELVDFALPLCRSGANAGRPAGYAISTYASSDAAERAIKALDGRNFDGRELRAKSLEDDNHNGRASPPSTRRKPAQKRPRYFDDGSDTKPARQSNVMRCFLCASDAHLAEACPNQLCRRCRRPGHVARDCRNPPRPMPELCTACGAVGHSWKWCEAGDGEARLSDGATCMVCGREGHLICGAVAGPATHDVYCAWCARAGHTEPSCPMKQAGGRRSPTGSRF